MRLTATTLLVLLAATFTLSGQTVDYDTARPWTFWYWMYSAVSKEGIRADLQAMEQAGLAGAYLMPIQDTDRFGQFERPLRTLTPEWWETVRYTFEQADSLGLKMGLHICDGFALAGGRWIEPCEAMQRITTVDTVVVGGAIDIDLPVPPTSNDYYRDIATFAIPWKYGRTPQPESITTESGIDIAEFAAGTNSLRASDSCAIVYTYAEPFTLRSVRVTPSGMNMQACRLQIEASDNGTDYRIVDRLTPPRHGWQNGDYPLTWAVEPTTARFFRIGWSASGTEPGSEDLDWGKWRPTLKVRRIELLTEPQINQWEGKAGYAWRIAESSDKVATEDCVAIDSIVDLTAKVVNGRLTATLPHGEWKIVRMGHTPNGYTNATAGASRGLECDKLSVGAVNKQIDNWFGAFYKECGDDLTRRVVRIVHVDSWECGSQNWCDDLIEEFRLRNNYDLWEWLPALAGIPIESGDKSERVLRDLRRTTAELMNERFYGTIAGRAKQYGCLVSAESVAPIFPSDAMSHYRNVDLPMGEYWYDSPTHDKPNDVADAVSAAHIYSKPIVQAEGCTQLRAMWNESPRTVKRLIDANYAFGVNRVVMHVMVHNPYTDLRPGMTLDGIGFCFQREQSWWRMGAKGLVDYLTRCQKWLQRGVSVNDIAVYTGDEIPRRAVLPQRLTETLGGIMGSDAVEAERKRLLNSDLALTEQPRGVIASANILTPMIDPLRGYAYDSFNTDALLNLCRIEEGALVMPDGRRYSVFVVPLRSPLNPAGVAPDEEVKAKIEQMRRSGVKVIDQPTGDNDLSAYGIERDAIVPDRVAWAHRTDRDEEIYFVSNQADSCRMIAVSLRCKGTPRLIFAARGDDFYAPSEWDNRDGRTNLSVELDGGESVFVVVDCSKSGATEQLAERKQGKSRPKKVFDSHSTIGSVTEIDGWSIVFHSTGVETDISTLSDWSLSSDPRIKNYSGEATYTATVDCKQTKGEQWIDLGEVNDVAEVKINGELCQTVWCKPYRAEITGLLKRGTNKIEITVANTWGNAIAAADRGEAPFEGVWTNNSRYRLPEGTTTPSGLQGKVRIVSVKHR